MNIENLKGGKNMINDENALCSIYLNHKRANYINYKNYFVRPFIHYNPLYFMPQCNFYYKIFPVLVGGIQCELMLVFKGSIDEKSIISDIGKSNNCFNAQKYKDLIGYESKLKFKIKFNSDCVHKGSFYKQYSLCNILNSINNSKKIGLCR